MDDVRLDPESPQEEELALATMGAPSFFNCVYFPKQMTSVFAEEVLFAGVDHETVQLWRDALRYYLAKLAALNPGRRLLLKNPAHSARIPQPLALFPGAKFIHIHRDRRPYFIRCESFITACSPSSPCRTIGRRKSIVISCGHIQG